MLLNNQCRMRWSMPPSLSMSSCEEVSNTVCRTICVNRQRLSTGLLYYLVVFGWIIMGRSRYRELNHGMVQQLAQCIHLPCLQGVNRDLLDRGKELDSFHGKRFQTPIVSEKLHPRTDIGSGPWGSTRHCLWIVRLAKDTYKSIVVIYHSSL